MGAYSNQIDQHERWLASYVETESNYNCNKLIVIDMYTFSSKLKLFSFILMASFRIGYGFLTAPKDIQEVEKLLAAESHGGHGEAKHETVATAHALLLSKVAKLRKKVLMKRSVKLILLTVLILLQLKQCIMNLQLKSKDMMLLGRNIKSI
jgi:hypothetical protein